MSDSVQLDDQDMSSPSTFSSHRIIGDPIKPPMIGFIKRVGLAKTDGQAYYVLVGLGIAFIVLAVFIFTYFVFDIGKSKEVNINVSPEVKAKLPPEVQQKINASQKK